MKKRISLFVAAIMLMCSVNVFAEDLEVNIIGPDIEAEPLSLDDAQIGASYTIDGFAIVTPVEFMVTDFFAAFNADDDFDKRGAYNNSYNNADAVFSTSDTGWTNPCWVKAYWQESGVNADYLWLKLDITNLQKTDVDFSEGMAVKAVYQDDYEFSGWVRQINYDYLKTGVDDFQVSRVNRNDDYPNAVVLDPEKKEPIGMMYTGTYVAGVTVPNNVVKDKTSPLCIEVSFADGSTLTYYINK